MSNRSGFSLMEMLIACAVMGILSTGLVSLVVNSNSEVQYMETKVESLQIKSQLMQSLAVKNYCSCAFKGKTINKDTNIIASVPDSFALTYKQDGSCDPMGGAPTVKSNTQIPSSRLYIGQIKLIDVTPEVSSGQYKAKLLVPFDKAKSKLPRALKDIVLSMRLTADMSGVNVDKPIISCSADETGTPGFVSNYCYAIKAGRTAVASCADGFYLKSIYKWQDNNWDGTGGICCFGSTDTPAPEIIAGITNTQNSCVGCSFAAIIADCPTHPGNYADDGNGGRIRCPVSLSINWSNWIVTVPCNAPAPPSCGTTTGVQSEERTCSGKDCPIPKENRTVSCMQYDSSCSTGGE